MTPDDHYTKLRTGILVMIDITLRNSPHCTTNAQRKACVTHLAQAVELWGRFTHSDFALASSIEKYPMEWTHDH